ncbi:MAG TPA: methionyl-tRNA formyltransferase, partial [Bacteroidota bacterium]|nr:methionyl-tRNA formyltransferase [Bacteroidota bacterium]
MGTAPFAVPSLKALVDAGYPVAAVVTGPDMPRGRGQEVRPTAVRREADARAIPVMQPVRLKDPAFADAIRSLAPDLIVVVAFRVLPPGVFTLPRLGSINLHASLLPRYRGAAPINRALMNGEMETGVTTFFLEESVDTGNILLQARTPILPEDDAGTLHDRLADIGAEIVLHTVRLIEQGKAVPRPQDPALASPAPKIFRDDCRIDWHAPADRVRNQIRGLSPSPAAFTTHGGKVLKIYRAHPAQGSLQPGTVDVGNNTISVGTGDGLLVLEDLQQEGKRRMTAGEFL